MYPKRIALWPVCCVLFSFFVLTVPAGKAGAAGLLKARGAQAGGIVTESHKVAVTINNGYARTEVDQVFVNTEDRALEAMYTFPLPRRAALSELSLFIDGRERVGEVLERQQAKEAYEKQKKRGVASAHAEKNEYRTFQVSVSPVQAGSPVRVRLVYYQPLEIDLNIGRYVYPLAEGNVDEEQLAFWSVDDRVRGEFQFDLTLKSAFPLRDVRMPGYMDQARIEPLGQKNGEDKAATPQRYGYTAHLATSEGASLSKDIVFYYRLDDTTPARVELIPYRAAGVGENQRGSFMLVITPGASLGPVREGVDWVFVLDTSGSMAGEKIQTLAQGVAKVIAGMDAKDRFRLVGFNNGAYQITKGFLNATPEHISQAEQLLQRLDADGGTNLHAGLEEGLRKTEDERTTALILVSDGVANVGKTAHNDFLSLVRERDVRLFTFVMGGSANQPLLGDLAEASGGFSMDISTQDDLAGRILQARVKAMHENFHDVQIQLDGGKTGTLFPSSIGSLYLGQQAVLFGTYEQAGTAELNMSAKISGQSRRWRSQIQLPQLDEDNPEIERLWALAAIDENMKKIRRDGETELLRQEVVDLGIRYSLVTDYTSMVVLDEKAMEEYGLTGSNLQRVQRERAAQARKSALPARDYRADNPVSQPAPGTENRASRAPGSTVEESASENGGPSGAESFSGQPAAGPGSGPVGPIFLAFLGTIVLFRRAIAHR